MGWVAGSGRSSGAAARRRRFWAWGRLWAGWPRRVRLVSLALLAVALAGGGLIVFPVTGGATAQAGAASAPVTQRQEGVLAIVGAGGTGLYTTPGGEQITVLPAGTVLTAVGRSADSLWLVVVGSGSDSTAGWVEAGQVVIFGVEALPVMLEGSAPAPSATSPAGNSEAPVLLPTITPTPTHTNTPTPAPTPTFTSTPPPTPTPTPTASPTPSAPARPPLSPTGVQTTLVAVVRGGGAQLLDRPEGDVVLSLTTGTALTAWGRSADSRWLVVTTGNDEPGWVAAAQVVAFNVETLPVVAGDASLAQTEPEQATPEQVAPEQTAPANGEDEPDIRSPAAGELYATVAVTDSRLNIRSGPGTSFAVIGKALPGERFVATGRNRDATWVEIETPALDEGFGWVAAEFVSLSGPISTLPISERRGETVTTSQTAVVTTQVVVSRSEVEPLPGLTGRMAFQGSGGAIYLYDLATGDLRRLTTGFDPAISPDGQTIAFTRIGGDNGLYLIDADGGNERKIYGGGENLRAPTWSPDGRWIAFVRIAGDYSCRDLGFGICLPNNPFLESFPLERRPEWGLSRVDVNGEQYRDLPALTSVQAPNWNAAGIVYQSNTGLEITDDRPDATTRAVANQPFYQDPAWQPNGDRIVFQSREGSHWEIFVVNADGSGLSALTRPVTTLVDELPSNVAPAWSPDGRYIVYLSNRNEENSAGEWRLWVMAADGSNQRPLPLATPFEYSYNNEQIVSWGGGSG